MKKVAIGISGGVDSSVAAYILKKQGYEVIGVFLELGHPMPPHLPQVMKQIDVPWVKMPLKIPFSTAVIEKTLTMYKHGYTPNPCSICNRDAKMLGLFNAMKELDAHFMATGHYSRVVANNVYKISLLQRNSKNSKDQTYFLSLIDKNIVPYLIFPLGNMNKGEIYKIAAEIGILELIGKKESQDICFSKKMSDFLKHHLGEKTGDIILFPENTIIGQHKGVHLYTVGERLGAHPMSRERLYVIKKDTKTNTLYVAPKGYLLYNIVKLTEVNMFVENIPKGTDLFLQTRYRGPLAKVNSIDGNIIKLNDSIEATPGQIGAIFDKDGLLLMGGIIEGGDRVENL